MVTLAIACTELAGALRAAVSAAAKPPGVQIKSLRLRGNSGAASVRFTKSVAWISLTQPIPAWPLASKLKKRMVLPSQMV